MVHRMQIGPDSLFHRTYSEPDSLFHRTYSEPDSLFPLNRIGPDSLFPLAVLWPAMLPALAGCVTGYGRSLILFRFDELFFHVVFALYFIGFFLWIFPNVVIGFMVHSNAHRYRQGGFCRFFCPEFRRTRPYSPGMGLSARVGSAPRSQTSAQSRSEFHPVRIVRIAHP